PSVISGWRGMHYVRAARIDWIQYYDACSIAGMAVSLLLFSRGRRKPANRVGTNVKGTIMAEAMSLYTSFA
ncbi:hypothetical protein, partial [Ralstonia solanacearum]|uniref:hypothetical protein n=1 Tax=Ralstonia solanacearum TaxID=305 RepID=UPI0022A8341C